MATGTGPPPVDCRLDADGRRPAERQRSSEQHRRGDRHERSGRRDSGRWPSDRPWTRAWRGTRAQRTLSALSEQYGDACTSARRALQSTGLPVLVAIVVAGLLALAAGAVLGAGARSIPLGAGSPVGGSVVLGLVGAAAAGGDDEQVEELVDGVRELAAGERDVSFDVDADGGLGRLAAELDDLADSLAERERRHEEYVTYTDDVLDAIDDVFYVLDRDGRYQQWNDTFREVTGYEDDEIEQMHPAEFFTGEDRQRIASAIDEAFETGHTRVEATVVTADGEELPYEFVASRLESPDGTPVVTGVGRDVSDRQRYEERLAAVSEAVRRLEGAETETEIAETVCSIVDEELAESLCMLWFYDEDEDVLVPAASTDDAASVVEESLDGEPPVLPPDGVAMQVFRDGESTVIEDCQAATDATYPDAPIRTALTVPVGDAGLLAICYPEVAEVDATTRELAEILGQHAAASLERVEREQRLARYKEFTDDVMDSIDEVFYVVGEDLGFQRWNDTLERVTGYDGNEIASMQPRELVAEDDRDAVADAIDQIFSSGSTRIEARVRTKDGETIPYEFTGASLEDPDGNRVLVGVGRDVSERVEYERELEAIVENTTDPIYIKDRESRYVFANQAAADYIGLEVEEVLGRTDRELFEEDSSEAREDDEQVVESGEAVTREIVHEIDGEEVVFLDHKYPYRDDRGEVVGVMGISRDITERVQRERDLEARTAAMEQSIDGMAILDEDERYDYVNRAHADVYGYDDPGALVGEQWRMCYTDEEIDRLESEVLYELAEVGSWRGEAVGQRADGSTFPQELSLTMLDDGRVICVVRDVTDRVERERELQRTTDLLEQAQRIADIGAWSIEISDGEPASLEWTDELYDIFELPRDEEPPDEGVFEFYHPEDREDHRAAVERAAETGEPWDQEIRLITASGTERWVRNMGTPVVEDGRTVEIHGAIQDVTDRVERERELEETNARLGAVVEASPAALVAIDADGDVQLWNAAAEEIFGWTEDEVLGEELPFVPERKRAEFRELRDRLFEDGASVTDLETVRETKGGREVDASLSIAPLRDEAGEVVGAMAAMLDVSERKQYERELERTTELLEQAQYVADVGGWELDLRSEPPEMTWTEELYDIHGVDPDTDVDVETTLECYHPDDRDRIERTISEAIEEGEPYDTEARLATGDDEERWIRAIGRPVWEGDEIVALRGSIQEITDHKRRETVLERTRDLLQQAQHTGGVGGWELDVSERPYEGIWTEQLFEILEIDPREPFTLQELFEYVHPDDRDWVTAEVTRGIESREPFSLEHRIVTDGGDERWVSVVAEPVTAGEDVYRGAIIDVTAQKEREVILESLHETARGLLQTQTGAEVAELAMETAADVLAAPCSAVFLLDDDSGQLEPVAFTDEFEARCGGPHPSSSTEGSSLLWQAYVSESATTLSEASIEEAGIFEASIREAVYVPIGDHGVFVVASPEGAITPETRRVAETLVATMEAALHRLDSENDLREREAELEARNSRLRRQVQINEIIRTVDQSLIGASSREEIETAVCERLTESGDVAFAWIGTLDATEGAVVPRAWAGTSHDYLDAISLAARREDTDPAVRTATTDDATVVASVVQAVKSEDWRKHALVSNFSSAIAVPIELDEYTYGVLGVYGSEPEQFGDLELDVFEELGESIANSINAVETRQALYADVFVELTIRVDDSEDFLARVASETGSTVEYVGLGTHSEDESRVFFEVAGAEPAAVDAMLEGTVSVGEYRHIGESGDAHLYEASVAGDVLAAHLVRRGGVPRSITASAGGLETTIDVPASIDVREFVETLRDRHPSAELVTRRDVERDVETRQELVSSMFDALTERQIEVLRTAYFAGFFDWPRESTGEDIAELLDVSQPTVNRHVRHGLNRLLEQLFEEEPATIAGAH